MAASLKISQLTPVIIVDKVETCLPFWVDRLGFNVQAEVPSDDGGLVFAILQKDGIEVMYQTKASVIAETPNAANELQGHSIALFLTVDDINGIEKAIVGAPIVKPRHHTFYGTTEIYVREPGGNIVGFSQQGVIE